MRAEPPVPTVAMKAIRAPFLEAGATLTDPPVIQPLNELLDLAGETMRARLFIVQGENGSEACLRPDFTVPVTRAHIATGAPSGRYRYEGKAFRVARKGDETSHFEEFIQMGLEAYGERKDPPADAAIAAIAWRAALAGGRQDLAMHLGDTRIVADVLRALETPPRAAARIMRALGRRTALAAALDKAKAPAGDGREGLAAELALMAESDAVQKLEEAWASRELEPVGGRSALEIVTRLRLGAQAARERRMTEGEAALVTDLSVISGAPDVALDQASAVLVRAGVDIATSLDIVAERTGALVAEGVPADRLSLAFGFRRPFSYYAGFLFDITSTAFGPGHAVAAGGRYDPLLRQLGGPAGGHAIGCMVRPFRAWSGSAA